ncbi:MAG: amidohydrolase [Acidimicrobiales bacterium]|jgi:predicted amidohydrolase YtcJ|nr:amidohydrolase [Acidimicrobiales bacterium]|tara:strand:+ start:5964 stop:7553 length:1590 start_codon:yes stop_codon:yes gene_type:complete
MTIADHIFVNATFRTLDPTNPSAEALASWQGRILAIGDRHDVEALTGPGTATVDLGGTTVLPGFIETHMHPLLAGVQMTAPQIGTPPCRSVAEVVDALRDWAATTPPGEVIQAWGYDDSLIDDNRHLTLHDLDEASTVHPILVRHISGHLSYANSAMLARAGVDDSVEDPPGGAFIRDAGGHLTGEMHETANFNVASSIPPATVAELVAGARAISDRCLERGVTSTTDAAVMYPTMYSTYQQAIESGAFRIRARLFPIWQAAEAIPFRTGLGGDRLSLGAMKFISDGSIQGYTACLCKGYYDRPDVMGTEVIAAAELTELVTDAHQKGWQVAIHTNGDQAIDNALDAVEAALDDTPRADHRHRLEHVQMAREDQLERMARLGVLASVFANHVWYWGGRHRDRFLGPERAERIDPLASFAAHGIPHALHCDAPVTPIDPLFSLWTAVTRTTRDGEVLGPAQRASVEAAVAGYTSSAAYLNMEERDKGTLEAGKLADLVVLGEDPFEVEPDAIRDIDVLATVVGGSVEFSA